MIYFFNNDLGLEKVVTSSNILMGNHEHELNNLIRADVVLDLEHALSFIDDVDFFGYYYKDVFYLHKITRQETEHEAEVMALAGRHIFFEDMLYSEVIKDIRPQNRDAKFMLDQAIGGHTRWNVVMTDSTGTLSTNFYWQMPYEALEWIVEHFRLEYLPVILFDGQKINGYELHVKKRLGENKGIRIPWGERVEKLNYEVDYSDIVTQLAPRGKGEEIGEDVYGRRINISDVNFSRNGVVSPVGNLYLEDKNLTAKYGNDGGKPRKGEGEFYDIDDVNELAEAGYQMYLDVSRPQVVISADVVDIGDVTIGDGVNIIRREHDLYFEARVHKIGVDLLNPDDAQVELGDYEHFKESKVQKSNRKRIQTIEKEVHGRIYRLEIEFNENFDGVVNQWNEEFEQAVIDAHAEIQSAEERMESLINSTREDWTDRFDAKVAEVYRKADENYNRIETEITETIDSTRSEMETNFNADVQSAREYADSQIADKEEQYKKDWDARDLEIEQSIEKIVGGSVESLDTNLLDVNSRLLSKLDESDLQPLYGRIDDAFSDISDVSVDLDTTRSELQGQLDDAFDDIGKVSGNLDTARSELQEQLDDAKAELEALEVGGRNLIPNSIQIWNSSGTLEENVSTPFGVHDIYLYSGEFLLIRRSVSNEQVNPYGKYTFSVYMKAKNEGETRDVVMDISDSYYNHITVTDEWQRFSVATDKLNNNRLYTDLRGVADTDVPIYIAFWQVEEGNMLTHWTPAPEDTEAKITTLSESIEYIDGQLEAKLNRTEIEPIQNKITEYGTTLDANAESIGLLQDKVQLYDDDIEQWSNQATSTAEEVSRILTHNSEQDDLITSVTNESRETAEGLERVINRVSETESGISTAKTDIIANADLIGATMTRVDENDRAIGNFQATADGLKADFARYQSDFGDDMSDIQSQVASYQASVDGFRTEVVSLQGDIDGVDNWIADKGAIIDGNADAIRTRIWQQDIDAVEVGGRNLLQGTSAEWEVVSLGSSYYRQFVHSEVTLEVGETYTFSVIIEKVSDDNVPINVSLGTGTTSYQKDIGAWRVNNIEFGKKIILTKTITESDLGSHSDTALFAWRIRNERISTTVRFKDAKLEKGNKATDWTPAPEDTESKITQLNTDITVEAGRINTLLTRVSETESSIADINLNVDGITADFARYQSDFGDEMEEIQSQVASYEASVDGITADFANYKRDIDSDVGALSAQVASYESSVDGFRAEVVTLQGDIDDVDNWITDKGVIIDGNADAIRTRIWKNDIDAIEVGGRNLLLNSEEERMFFKVFLINYPLNENTKHILEKSNSIVSFDMKHGEGSEPVIPHVYYRTSDGQNKGHSYGENKETSTEYQRFIIPIDEDKIPDDMSEYNTLTIRKGDLRNEVFIKNIKLETGNKATDWTPAPEDTEAKIYHVEQSIANVYLDVDGITADFANYQKNIDSNVGALSSQVASYEASVDGFRAEVGTLQGDIDSVDSWIADKGSIIDGNADAISARVWQQDIANTNLIPHFFDAWEYGTFWSSGTNNNNASSGIRTIDFIDVVPGERYYIQDYSLYVSAMEELQVTQFMDGEPLGITNFIKRGNGRSILMTGNQVKIGLMAMSGFTIRRNFVEHRDERIKMKLEEGSIATPWIRSDKDFLRQTDFILESDGFFLGGKYIDGEHYSTAILGSASGLKLLGDTIVEDNLYVRGIIEGHALNAVEAEVGRVVADHIETITIDVDDIEGITATFNRLYTLNANIERLVSQHVFADGVNALVGNFVDVNAGNIVTSGLSANIIKGEHIESNTITVQHLYGADAILEYLMARNVFSNEVTTLSLNAVYADLRKVNSEIMDTNILKADWIQGGNALIDKVFANTAMFERMMSKSGFVRTLNTITIDTDQLTIRRPDGGVLVSQGTQRFGSPIITKPFPGQGVEFDGANYITPFRGRRTFERAYSEHSGRWANFSFRIALRWDSAHSSAMVGITIRPQTTPSGVYVPNTFESFRAYRDSGGRSVSINVRLPVPTFGAMSWVFEFYIDHNVSGQDYPQIRSERCWTSA